MAQLFLTCHLPCVVFSPKTYSAISKNLAMGKNGVADMRSVMTFPLKTDLHCDSPRFLGQESEWQVQPAWGRTAFVAGERGNHSCQGCSNTVPDWQANSLGAVGGHHSSLQSMNAVGCRTECLIWELESGCLVLAYCKPSSARRTVKRSCFKSLWTRVEPGGDYKGEEPAPRDQQCQGRGKLRVRLVRDRGIYLYGLL